MSDLIRLDDVRSIPDMTIGQNGDHTTDGYTWIDLTSPEYATPPDPPAIEGMLYAGRRHVISGPPESTKTLVAYLLLLSALRSGEGVAILDFEMGPHAAVTLLRELGATEQEVADVHYTEPAAPPTTVDIARLVGLGIGYCLLDAAAGAYDATGLDDNSRKDAETFAGHWIRPLWQNGIATIVIDHVTKNADTRGKFAIGSERKTGQADVHLSLEALKPLHRGGTGLVKINVHKDRPGHLPRPTLYVIDLTSDPHTHRITWELRQPAPVETAAGTFHYTIYMERVSRVMETSPNHTWSRNELETETKGGRDFIRSAIDSLHLTGHISESEGARGAREYTLLKPFREAQNDLATTSPPPRHGEVPNDLATSPPPIGGEASVAASSPDHLATGEVDVYSDDIQHLLDEVDY